MTMSTEQGQQAQAEGVRSVPRRLTDGPEPKQTANFTLFTGQKDMSWRWYAAPRIIEIFSHAPAA